MPSQTFSQRKPVVVGVVIGFIVLAMVVASVIILTTKNNAGTNPASPSEQLSAANPVLTPTQLRSLAATFDSIITEENTTRETILESCPDVSRDWLPGSFLSVEYTDPAVTGSSAGTYQTGPDNVYSLAMGLTQAATTDDMISAFAACAIDDYEKPGLGIQINPLTANLQSTGGVIWQSIVYVHIDPGPVIESVKWVAVYGNVLFIAANYYYYTAPDDGTLLQQGQAWATKLKTQADKAAQS